MRGKGEAQAGCYIWPVTVGDVVYVSPSDPHQFRCPADATEPFGFLCMVNATRDKPQLPSDGELERLRADAKVAAFLDGRPVSSLG